MGKKSEKHFMQNELFCFWGSEGGLPGSDRRWAGATRWALLGGKTAQTPGSLPPKSRFSSAVILQTDSRVGDSWAEPYLDAPQNAKHVFRPEHCVCFSVLPHWTTWEGGRVASKSGIWLVIAQWSRRR